MKELRPYQQNAIDSLRTGFSTGNKRLMVVQPCGAGKGNQIVFLLAEAFKKGNKCLAWCHKRELVIEIKDRLEKIYGIKAGLILAGEPVEKGRRIQIASVMTAIRRDLSWFDPDLVLTDECHRILSDSQMTLLAQNENKYLIGFTATPVRQDKKKFSDVFCDIVHTVTYRELMKDKFLVPTEVLSPKGSASLEGVRIRRGDYDEKELSDRFSQQRLYEALYSKWKEYTGGRMTTIIFNVDKRHNREVFEFFKAKGVNVAMVDESTPIPERDAIVKRFKNSINEPMVLCNIAVFSEGVDAPAAKCVVLNYATKSFAKYVQSTARGSRPVWDGKEWLEINGKPYKSKLIVLDFGGNTVRHGKLEDYDAMGFDLSGKKKEGNAPVKECPKCHHVIYASYRECPECNYKFPENKKKDKKQYADEVQWEVLDEDRVMMKRILEMKPAEINKVKPEWLRIVAYCKGYQSHWVQKVCASRGEYQEEFKGTPFDWQKFWTWIEGIEKEKGTYNLLMRLKSKTLAK